MSPFHAGAQERQYLSRGSRRDKRISVGRAVFSRAVVQKAIRSVKNLTTAKEAVRKQTKLTAETTRYSDLKETTSLRRMKLSEQLEGVGAIQRQAGRRPAGDLHRDDI